MKIQIDGQDVYELLPWQEAVIKNDIPNEIFVEDMKRRARYIWEHKFEQCMKRFEEEWMPKLRQDPNITSIPSSQEAFVNMVLARPEYKSRSQRSS